MAGSNILLKQGRVLFKQGDKSNGMYLVRKGELNVFIEKDGHEVSLAKINAGNMIGEMSLFENKPRSASAQAVGETEVTLITTDDFEKLMKQIPKWFVSLMGSLSSRLRQTNERLQVLENQKAGALPRFETVFRLLHVLNLLWHKDGNKEDKVWLIHLDGVLASIRDIFHIDKEKIEKIVNVLVNSKVVSSQKDGYNNQCLALKSKGNLEKFVRFCAEFIEKSPGRKALSSSAIEMLNVAVELSKESAYETVNVSFEDIMAEGERRNLDTSAWKEDLSYFRVPVEGVTLLKASNGITFRIDSAKFPVSLEFHIALRALDEAKVA